MTPAQLPIYRAIKNEVVVFEDTADLVKVPVPGKKDEFRMGVKHDRVWSECLGAYDAA